MSNRRRSLARSSAPSNRTQLPKRLESLEFLFSIVARIVEQMSAYRHRQRLRVKIIRDLASQPEKLARSQALAQELDHGMLRQAREGLAAAECLIRYMDADRMLALTREWQRRREDYGALPLSSIYAAEALECLLDVDDRIFDQFSNLQDRLLAELDRHRAVTGAVTERNLQEILPRNDRVTELFRRLGSNDGQSMSEMQVALDFTCGDEAEAKNLLRGVRRFRNRLEQLDDREPCAVTAHPVQ